MKLSAFVKDNGNCKIIYIFCLKIWPQMRNKVMSHEIFCKNANCMLVQYL